MRSEQLGLLLYRGGTVYNDGFDNTTAEAICRQMNFSSAIEWRTGMESNIQLEYEVAASIFCKSMEWDPKRCYVYELAPLDDWEYYFDRMDVFLKCKGNSLKNKRFIKISSSTLLFSYRSDIQERQ